MSEYLIHRSAVAAMLGGAAWALFPLGTPLVETPEAQGAPTSPASIVHFALLLVVPAALLLAGLVGLRVRHRGSFRALGVAGTVVSFLGVALMGTGNGVEVVSLATVGDTDAVGYAMTMIGFLLLLIGSPLLGAAVVRAGVLPSARAAGLALALAVPVGIGLAVLTGMLGLGGEGSNFGFWLGMTTPYGLASIIAGHALLRSTRTPALA